MPRVINAVADRALCIAFEQEKKTVSATTIKKAIEIVRHKRSLFAIGFKNFIKDCCITVFAKIPLLLAGLVISALTFALAYFYLPHHIDSQSIQSLVSKDETVNTQYQKVMQALMPFNQKERKELYEFNESIKQSVFLSDSLNTLIKVWGYERYDNLKATCVDLEKVKLKCSTLSSDLQTLKLINRPSVLNMRTDDMIPYYVLLKEYGADTSEIIVGDKLWVVKTKFIEHYFDGQFTYISKAFSAKDKIDIIPFNRTVLQSYSTDNGTKTEQLLTNIRKIKPNDTTALYPAVIEALMKLSQEDMEKYNVSIIAMTDGKANVGTFSKLKTIYNRNGKSIPIYSIMFGSAAKQQLQDMATLSNGKVFDGKQDLKKAFKEVRGYN